jgi:hypothetical protein
MSNHYLQWLDDNDALDHEPGLNDHVRDPFMARHFVDWLADSDAGPDGATPIDLEACYAPSTVTVETTDDLTRREERIIMRVANKCGYKLRRVDDRRGWLLFRLDD